MRQLVVPFVLLMAACTGTPPSATETAATAPPGAQGRLDVVLDGDSLRIVLDGVSTEVRLLGVNAPERDECWADESRAALQNLVDGVSLTVVSGERDQYGRLLAHVYSGASNVNLEMVAGGHALATATQHGLLADYLAAETDAIALQHGLWRPGACGAEPFDHGVSIWSIEPDAPGRDDVNPNGEFVVLANDGPDQDMTGWKLRDESSVHRYTFPDGFVLESGALITVRSGCGADDDLDLYWCATTTVWTNSGDTVMLLDPSGAVVERIRYQDD